MHIYCLLFFLNSIKTIVIKNRASKNARKIFVDLPRLFSKQIPTIIIIAVPVYDIVLIKEYLSIVYFPGAQLLKSTLRP